MHAAFASAKVCGCAVVPLTPLRQSAKVGPNQRGIRLSSAVVRLSLLNVALLIALLESAEALLEAERPRVRNEIEASPGFSIWLEGERASQTHRKIQ